MKYAVIAAGEGSRLAAEGVYEPKPLVRIGGERLIDRLIRIFMANDAEEIVVICNDQTAQVAQHLVRLQRDGLKGRPVPLRFVIKSTPSSMHSFYEISKYLQDTSFILTTVDTVFKEEEFAEYVEAFKNSTLDGLMGVTDYVDDESPLFVEVDSQLIIRSFLDEAKECKYISAGIYGLRESALFTLHNCIAHSEQRMRNFQRALLADGRKLKAYPFGQVFDIDHAADIGKAEQFLSNSHG
ncbi:MAG: NTP transferase domain-containing protein [Prevotella sp.]|nr:NTP transferase domain-containing protein [Prevotella sp.]